MDRTYKNIEENIFVKRNEIVKLKVNNSITDEEREQKIAFLRKDIADKENLLSGLLRMDMKRSKKHIPCQLN